MTRVSASHQYSPQSQVTPAGLAPAQYYGDMETEAGWQACRYSCRQQAFIWLATGMAA